MIRKQNEVSFYWEGDKVELWYYLNGENNFRLNYNLKKSDLVIDLGGYKGEWAKRLYDKYECGILIFEPVRRFCSEIEAKFKNVGKVKIYNYALGGKDCKDIIHVSDDASSVINKIGKEVVEIEIKSIRDFIDENQIGVVKLLKINIEGSEYELLEFLIENKLIEKFENIQVQFHNFVPYYRELRQAISNKLYLTHELTYNFDMVWENWRLKN